LFAGQSVSSIGDALVLVALPFAVFAIGGSGRDVGLVLAAGWVPMIAFVLVGGVIADRFERKRVMIASDLMRLAAHAAVAALILSGRGGVWELALLQALWGVGAAFFRPASSSITPQTVTPANLQGANALMQSSANLSFVIGPAIAGLVLALAGAGWAFAANAGTFAVSVAFLVALRPVPVAAGERRRQTFVKELREGWGEFSSRTWLWLIVVLAALFHLLVLPAYGILGAVVAEADLGGGGAWGALNAAFGLGAVAGSVVSMYLRLRRPLVVAVAGLAPYCAVLGLLADARSAAAVAVALVAAGFGLSLCSVFEMTVIQKNVPPQALSRVMAYNWLASLAPLPIGYALIGPVADAAGLRTTLTAIAIAWGIAVTALVLTPSIRRVTADDRRPASEDVSPTAA
nr:MFS transporter [Actinomycetota bacterium]